MGGLIQMKKRRTPILTDNQILLAIFHELKNRTEKEETVGKIHTSRTLWKYLIDLMDEKERNLTFREIIKDKKNAEKKPKLNDLLKSDLSLEQIDEVIAYGDWGDLSK